MHDYFLSCPTGLMYRFDTKSMCELKPMSGDTRLFITPGYQFNTVDGLITNFHLSESTLLMLVSAFAGIQEIRHIYQHAIDKKYRFFSYGDAMIILPEAA